MPKINLKAPAAIEILKTLESSERLGVSDICELIPFSKSTVSSIVKVYHTERKIYISGWKYIKNTGWIKMYSIGDCVDLPQPKYNVETQSVEPVVEINEVWPRCDIAASWLRNPT